MQLDPNQFNKVEIIFLEELKEEKAVKVYDLSYYLYLVKALYTFLYKTDNIYIKDMLKDIHYDIVKNAYVDKKKCSIIIKFIRSGKLTPSKMYDYFTVDLGEDDLYIKEIRKDSPLTIWFAGAASLMIIAFIISGGEFELSLTPPRIKVKMSGIGVGLEKIKELFKSEK